MPKRKRAQRGRDEVNPAEEAELKKRQLERKLVHGKKVLNRALKTARGFERQKLSKRIKLATTQHDGQEAERLQRELGFLKTLDLSLAVESHLFKTLLKSKSIHESGLLPEHVKTGDKKSLGSQEEIAAVSNVTARLYNTKHVKETMSHIMSSVYLILGIKNPTKRHQVLERDIPEMEGDESAKPAECGSDEEVDDKGGPTPEERPRVFDNPMDLTTPDSDLNSNLDPEMNGGHDSNGVLNALVGASSSEETDGDVDDDTAIIQAKPHLGIQMKPKDTSDSFSDSSQSSPLTPRPKKTPRQAQQPPSKPGSTFLPTLMGGYWSGSESATDVEESSTRKKNRPGQQARRALWEKKFGAKANHLKSQTPGKSRDQDWDPRRGARGAGDGRYIRGRASRKDGLAAFAKAREHSTGENAVEVKPRARGMGKKDDAGPLHPSWEAAKKAKEAKKTALFQGKKVVFE